VVSLKKVASVKVLLVNLLNGLPVLNTVADKLIQMVSLQEFLGLCGIIVFFCFRSLPLGDVFFLVGLLKIVLNLKFLDDHVILVLL